MAISIKMKLGTLFLYIQILISLCMLMSTPKCMIVDMQLFYITFSLAIISLITFFVQKKKKNYLDFDTIFVTVGYLICFFSTFFYEQFFYDALFLGFEFDHRYINYASIVSLIGFQSYFIGSLSCKGKSKESNSLVRKTIPTNFLSIIIIICGICFLLLGGLDYYKSIYSNEGENSSPYVTHILLIICISSIVLTATEFYNSQIYSRYKVSKLTIYTLTIFCIILLFVGNRTTASQILLPIFILYAMYKKNINLKFFGVFMALAIFTMWIFQSIRSDKTVNFEQDSIAFVLSDLTIPSRATYAALEYVDDNNYTYGKNMLGGIVGTIPFLASGLGLDADQLGSAEILTNDAHRKLNTPRQRRIGLGTTIIADIYLSFGTIGVIILMYILGYYICYFQNKSYRLYYYSIIIYAALIANSVFLTRASYTHPFKYIILGLLVAYLNKNIIKILAKK